MSKKLPRGRPSTFATSVGDEICRRIAEGETLRSICREPNMPAWRTVYGWMEANEEFRALIGRARELGFDAIAEEALEIADTPITGVRIELSETGKKEVRDDMLGHRKLQVETRLKLLAKWSPKKYGERAAVELTGAEGGPVQIDETTAAAKLAAIMATAQARKDSVEE